VQRFATVFLYLCGGLIVWMARFIGVYAFTGLACARSWQDTALFGIGLVPAVLVLSAALGISACLALILYAVGRLRRSGEENARFIHVVAALVAGIGALAMAQETAPILFLPICAA
jgi:hypothetical protein